MAKMIAPDDLRELIRSGLLSFPVTPFNHENTFDPHAFAAHLEWLSPHKIAGLSAGGTGELFSLSPAEVIDVVKTARVSQPTKPVIAGWLWYKNGLRYGSEDRICRWRRHFRRHIT